MPKSERIVPVVSEETGRVDLNLCLPGLAGQYVGPVTGYTGDVPAVFFVLPVPDDHPDFGLRHVTAPPHEFVEEPNGHLTIRPSILAVRPDGGGWHGYLEAGTWREV